MENEGLAPGDAIEYDGVSGEQQGQQQGNPAWSEFLEVVPQELHHKVTPILKSWDDKVSARFDKVHSDYSGYKAFKDKGVDPAILQQGVQIYEALQSDPRRVFEALTGAYPDLLEGLQQQNSGQGQHEPSAEDLLQKRLDAMDAQQRQLAELMIAQNRAEEQNRADQALDRELSDMRKKHGDFDEEWVLSKLQVNPKMSIESAVQAYQNWENSVRMKYQPKPLFQGGGSSGLPGSAPDVKKLSDKDTRDYVAEILRAHHTGQQ